MNEFRERLLSGKSVHGPLLRSKPSKAESPGSEEESLVELAIPRSEARVANHRDGDRHRLDSEQALLIHKGNEQIVALVNLSGGGAMIDGADGLMLWDRVEVQLGECDRLEAIVRWIKGSRVGLEFAHETRIDAGSEELARTLQAVIRRSFPDVALEVAAVEPEAAEAASPYEGESEPAERSDREVRHPLIWTGLVHYNHDSTPVRLRNISGGGALIEGAGAFPVGAELLLDLGEAGAIFGSVHWARGDQAGLKFHAPFDVEALANARPEIAGPRWIAPDYLREDRSSSSPWASQWGRSNLADLHRTLESTRAAIKRR